MAKLKMQWVSIYALRRERKPLLERLQRLGVLEVETAEMPEEGFTRLLKEDEAAGFERSANTARQALDILGAVAPMKKGLLASLSGRREVSEEVFTNCSGKAKDILQDCHKTISLHKRTLEIAAEKTRLRTALAQLEPWRKLDVPFGFSGTKSAAAFIGTLPAAYTAESLYARLGETGLLFDLEILDNSGTQTGFFAMCPRRQAEEMEQALRQLGFSRPPALGGETNASLLPAEDIHRIEAQMEALTKEDESIRSSLEKMAAEQEDIQMIVDYYTVRAEKYRVISRLDHSKNTFIVTGYIPEVDVPLLRQEIEGAFTAVMETEEADPVKAPVKLHNNAFARPAESITEMYAMPLASDIDPTPVMSFFFYLFFGMMLSDAGYGLLLFFGAWFLIKKYKPEPSMERNLRLFMYCGVSTTLWGIVFGSFFGDIVEQVAKTYFGAPDTFLLFPHRIDPVNNAVLLLVMSLALGLIQILAGLGCRFYMQWRSGDKWGAVFDTGFWMTTLLGAAVFAVGMALVPPLTTVGAVIAVASLLGLVLTQGRKKKGPMKIVSGLASLYDVTGYVSDLMSYSRLMALGLTTGVMGSVFNMLGTMFGKNVVGVIALIIIFLVGHAINFGINALGTYVHTIRLQYVELFSKFYEGGGRPFRPFAFRSQYIRIKEEEKL